MSLKPIRWLHLSDFHVGKSNYPQIAMFNEILSEVQKRATSGTAPDIIFITGDIAHKGLKEEYETFYDKFYVPLIGILTNWNGKIYSVPGNHDVNRSKAEAVRKHDVMDTIPDFLDPDEDGLVKRQPLLARFYSYKDCDISNVSPSWIESAEGAYTDIIDIRGCEIGILGLNTAWLSENDNDRNKLTPGTGIIKEGLRRIGEAKVKIVLGHHPLNWFRDVDIKPIRSLLGQKQAIYLHGHLHEVGSVYEDGGGHLFRSIQAGASFQVRPEDKILKNSICWCELDPESLSIKAEPLNWNYNNNEWNIDANVFQNAYKVQDELRWELPLHPSSSTKTEEAEIQPPPGWRIIDKSFLEEKRRELPLTREDVLRFFDGRIPVWRHAVCPDIPKRAIVKELKDDFLDIAKRLEPHMILILGTVGEGKSTVLRQTVCELIDIDNWNILWHQDPESELPFKYIASLTQEKKPWLIVSDEADIIVKDIFKAIGTVHEANRNDIHFLLCASYTNWIAAKGEELPWNKYVKIRQKKLLGISPEDATSIVTAWGKYGEKGLGKLTGIEIEKAAQNLLEAAKSEAYPKEGAFLGAMLRVRFGEDFDSYVLDLLRRLEGRKAPGGTLLNAPVQ